MARKLAPAVALISMVISATALALGLGDIQTRSALNQNFEAEVSLLSVDPSELDTLKVQLASPEAFQRAGVDRPFYLSSLRFVPMLNKAGKPVIRVYSTNPIREPFLNFLLEVNWPKGRLLREYTVLLDPPTTLNRRPAAVTRSTSGATAATAPANRASAPSRTVLPNEYQVSDSDTLWGIAKELRPSGVSLTQTLMALYKANPDAFINGDINRLKKGRILRVPSRDDMLALSRGQANAAYRAAQDTALASRAQPAAEPAAQGTAQAPADGEVGGSGGAAATDNAELRIAAPSPEGEGQAGAGDKVAEGKGAEDLENALLLARENAETSRQVAENLRGEVSTLEQQLADMQRLLSLKDEQLARLQAGVSEGEAATAEAPATDAEPVAPAADGEGAATDAGSETGSPAMSEAPAVMEGEMPAAAEGEAAVNATDTPAADTNTTGDETAAAGTEEAPAEGAVAESDMTASEGEVAAGDMAAAAPEGEAAPAGEAMEGTEGMASESDTSAAVSEGDEPDSSAPVMADAEPAPVPMDEATPADTDAPKGWLDRLMGNTPLLAGAAAAVIALLVGLIALLRRGKKGEGPGTAEATATAGTAAMATQPEPEEADDESILLEPGQGADEPTADDAGSHDDETSFLSEFSPSEMNSLADETSEVDPVSEADVYIAYGRYDQAEELLSQALQRDPDRLALKFKLLEVYYANRNIAGFTARAQELADAGQDAVDASGWQRVCDMGRDLAPDYPLFAGAGAGAAAASVDAASDFAPSEPAGFDPLSGFNEGSELQIPPADNASGVQDAAGDAGGETEMDLTLDLEDLSMPHSVSTDDESIDGLESIDLELPDLDMDPARPQNDKPAGDDSLMLDLDTSLEDSVADSRPASAGDEELDAESLQAQLDELSDLTELDDELSQLTADFDGLDMPTTEDSSAGEGSPGADLDIPSPFDDQLAEDDEVQTKLDLALAYVEMGDKEGARSILDEVKAEGNDVQKAQADKLLADLS